MMRSIATTAVLLLPIVAGYAEPTQIRTQVGDTYEISRYSESTQRTSGGYSGSSSDRDTLVERVTAVHEAGLELEYDLPKNTTAEDRARNWQFPARVFKPISGPSQLLNGPELDARVEAWLEAGHITRAACGHWIFTWNAFRIECDPHSVIGAIEPFDLRPGDLRDGAPYRDREAREPAPLRRKAIGPDGATFVVEMTVDPETVRRDLANSDLVVAEISRTTLTLDAALRARQGEQISGSILITFDTDSAGSVRRRATVMKLEIKEPDGQLETRTVNETVKRRFLGRLNS